MLTFRRLFVPILLLLTAMSLLPSSPGVAQGDHGLLYGEIIGGELTNYDGEYWKFSGRQGQIVSLEMNSEDFDTYIDLLDDTGLWLNSNDDGGPGFNSMLITTLPYTGTYIVVARSFAYNDNAGAYSLALNDLSDTATLTRDETVSGHIDGGLNQAFRYEGQAGEVISIEIVAEDSYALDLYTTLFDPDGYVMREDDDGGSDLNPAVFTVLPLDGTYTINIQVVYGTTGDFDITVRSVEPQLVTYEDVFYTAMENGVGAAFAFSGEAGEVVRIDVVSYDSYELDLYATLIAPEGYILLGNNDGGLDYNPSIVTVLPDSGEYLLIVETVWGEAGDYQIEVNPIDPPVLSVNEPVAGVTENGVPQIYQFAGNAGDTVTIDAGSDEIDTVLELYGPTGFLTWDDDGGGDLNSRILEYELPTDGTYIVMVHEYYGEEGSFVVELSMD